MEKKKIMDVICFLFLGPNCVMTEDVGKNGCAIKEQFVFDTLNLQNYGKFKCKKTECF